ncbi:MAG: hypothetical protein Q9M36_03880 [Sulfurovum sp.]|nr:hypothetical protein [Sulfurovum sp.]
MLVKNFNISRFNLSVKALIPKKSLLHSISKNRITLKHRTLNHFSPLKFRAMGYKEGILSDKFHIIDYFYLLNKALPQSTYSKEVQLQDRFIITNKSYILNKNIIQHKIDTITQTLPQLTQISKSIIVEKDLSKVLKETQFKTKTKTHYKNTLATQKYQRDDDKVCH